jgi:hypothetical protein
MNKRPLRSHPVMGAEPLVVKATIVLRLLVSLQVPLDLRCRGLAQEGGKEYLEERLRKSGDGLP